MLLPARLGEVDVQGLSPISQLPMEAIETLGSGLYGVIELLIRLVLKLRDPLCLRSKGVQQEPGV